MSDAIVIKVPGAERQAAVKELLLNEEGFKFSTLKLNRERPRYEIPKPTAADKDNIELVQSFNAVVLVVRKNFYQSDEDKEAQREGKEKRTLYILREGRITPERIFISPTSLVEWKKIVKQVAQSEQAYYGVVLEFGAEHVKSQKSGFAWNKVKFGVTRSLTEAELEYVIELRQWVDTRVGEYDQDQDLDKYEEEAVFGNKKADKPADDEDPRDAHSKAASASVEDDEADPAPAAAIGKKADGKAASGGGTKGKGVDDADSEDGPKAPGKKPDDDSGKPASAGRAGYPSLEDDEDGAPAATGGKPATPPDDEEED